MAWRCEVCSARYAESGWTLPGPPKCPKCGAQKAQKEA